MSIRPLVLEASIRGEYTFHTDASKFQNRKLFMRYFCCNVRFPTYQVARIYSTNGQII